MAVEESEIPEAPATAARGGTAGLLKAVGVTIGLFVMMLVTQLIGPVIGCRLLPSATPGCQATGAAETGARDSANKAPKAPPVYLPMDPPLVVSLQDAGTIRFLQVTLEVMARDEHVIEQVKAHMPVIRNNLLMMFGGQTVPALTSREDKEKLRLEALAEVQKILKAETGKPGIEELYFTSFVVQ